MNQLGQLHTCGKITWPFCKGLFEAHFLHIGNDDDDDDDVQRCVTGVF